MPLIGQSTSKKTHIVDYKKLRDIVNQQLIKKAKEVGEVLADKQDYKMKSLINKYFDLSSISGNIHNIYGAYSYFYDSSNTDYEIILRKRDAITLRITTGFDKRLLSYPKSIIRQQRNKGLYLEINDPKQYVFDLMWKQGIVGLPEYFTHKTINGSRQEVSQYANPYFAHFDGKSNEHGGYMGFEEYVTDKLLKYTRYKTKQLLK